MTSPRSHRRSAEETREAILDAAERRLKASGPASIRLQDVAAEAGISHPAVLHHFGSREGLVQAVVNRALESLQRDLGESMASLDGSEEAGAALFERVSEVLGRHGHARLIAWLVLEDGAREVSPGVRAGWEAIARLAHTQRLARTGASPASTLEDTRFTVVLSALALFALAIAGPITLSAAGFAHPDRAEQRFRGWLSRLVGERLGAEPKAPRG